MPDVLEPPQVERKPVHRFTRDNARDYAIKGNKIRWSQEPTKQQLTQEPAATPRITEPPSDGYTGERVVRVRAQLDRVDQMLLEADEPQAIERLSRAAGTLAEQLRVLEGKPLPGSRRPGREVVRAAAGPLIAAPIMPAPVVTVAEVRPAAPATPQPVVLPPQSAGPAA